MIGAYRPKIETPNPSPTVPPPILLKKSLLVNPLGANPREFEID
jgi:hypothetical protein